MRERGVGKPWNAEEDALLTQAVAIHGENDNWKTVALSVPGRTNKACRKRWLHSLSPSVKKSAWTAEEDQLLLSLYAVHSTKWAVIARHIPGRTDDACSKRYREALDPSLRRDEWTPDEDSKLLEAYGRLGGRWGQVGQELQRSGLGCRNRWRMLQRKQAAAVRVGVSASASKTTSPSDQPLDTGSISWDPSDIYSREYWHNPGPSLTTSSTASSGDFSRHLMSNGASYTVASGTYFGPSDSAYGQDHGGPSAPSLNYSEFSVMLNPSGPQLQPSQESGNHLISQAATVQSAGTSETLHLMAEPRSLSPTEDNQPSVTDTPAIEEAEYMCVDNVQDPDQPAANSLSSSRLEFAQRMNMYDPAATSSGLPVIEPVASSRSGSSSPAPDRANETSHKSSAVSSASYYRTPSEKARKVASPRHSRKGPAPRLSSTLPTTTDSTILAYACGHPSCWPTQAATSRFCFATSKELSDHNKIEHTEDIGGSTPFRCGLDGCRKSWKSINGLQYHLQLSKTHFQQALTSSAVPAESNMNNVLENSAESSAKPKKLFPCPQPQCRKQYKQLSGLRYHLAHGHPDEIPVQLDVLPPALARKIAEKSQGKTG